MNKFIKIFWVSILIFELLFPLKFVYAITQNNQIPDVPEMIEVTEYSITLKKIDGYEYSIDGGYNWQNSNVFSYLEPMTTYTFIQRIKETDTCEYSSNSETRSFTTNPLCSKPINQVPEGFVGVYNMEDLQKIKYNLSGNYILMNDIISDENMEELEPIGSEDEPFSGVFNGNNYSIVGIKQNNNTNLGLFGQNDGIIINLNVINTDFQITEGGEIIKKMGNVAAINYGEIVGCSSKNKIEIDKGTILGGKDSFKGNRSWYGDELHIGGIAGVNHGKIYFCDYDGKIDITTQEQYSNIGGIAGYNKYIIKNCYNLSEVISNNGYASSVGGICGTNTYDISYTYNTGNISNNNSYVDSYYQAFGSVGGLVGGNEFLSTSYLSYSYTLGKVFGERAYEGIFCGFNNGNITYCYSMYGDVENINGSGKSNNCYYIKDFVRESISQGIENAQKASSYGINFEDTPNLIDEIVIDNNSNYPFPYFKKLGMINVESNFIDYEGGNGLLNNPFRISNKEQFKNIEKNPYSYYVLINDIVFDENETFKPIENFYGVLDGNGYKIYDLNVNDDNEYTGLIRKNHGRILNLDIINPDIINTSDGYAGVYAGVNNGYIYNCKTELGKIEVNSSIVGSIAGENHYVIMYCSNSNSIKVNSLETAKSTCVGGLAGTGNGFIYNSSNSGDIIINSNAVEYNEIGGIAGSSGTISNCYNSGNIYFESDKKTLRDYFSGICNNIAYGIENCYNVGKVEYKSNSNKIRSAGVALSDGNGINNCYYLKDSIIIYNDDPVSNGVELENSAMQNESSYKNFDFTNIWQIENNNEYLYPTLVQQEVTNYELYPTIFGNISGSNINSRRIKVSLVDKTNNNIVCSDVFVDENGYYEINNIESGNYIISVLRDNLIIKSQEVIVEGKDIKIDFRIIQKGDINGDGKINLKDWNRMYSYITETSEFSNDEFELGDINSDAKVNIKDWNRMYNHINGTDLLY